MHFPEMNMRGNLGKMVGVISSHGNKVDIYFYTVLFGICSRMLGLSMMTRIV